MPDLLTDIEAVTTLSECSARAEREEQFLRFVVETVEPWEYLQIFHFKPFWVIPRLEHDNQAWLHPAPPGSGQPL